MFSPSSRDRRDDARQADGSPKPTVVLVHGAWADSSSWAGVIERLRSAGFPVRAVANPLQGLDADTDYLAAVLRTVEGPVVLAGHSYGGALISNVDAAMFDIKALVYVAAFIPALGETVGELAAQSSPSLPLVAAEVPGGTEVSIDPAGFREAFAGDLDDEIAARLAVVQRPANTNAVSEPATHAAYRTIPSWVLVTRDDRAISLPLQLHMARRANGRITEVNASHAVMVSRPDVVADVIEQAARAVQAELQV